MKTRMSFSPAWSAAVLRLPVFLAVTALVTIVGCGGVTKNVSTANSPSAPSTPASPAAPAAPSSPSDPSDPSSPSSPSAPTAPSDPSAPPSGTTPPAPSFSPAPGTYSSVQSVAISDGDASVVIRYTTDGSTPTAASPQYATPITVPASTMLRAVAFQGAAGSTIASGSYTISLPVSKIAFVTQPGSSTAGASIAPAVSVALFDSNGDQLSTATGTVSLALQQNGSTAALAGTTSSPTSAGIATFSNLVVNTPGSGYTLVATVAGLPAAQSASFTVLPQLPAEQAAEADSFVDSIGVQTHINYTDTAYANWPKVLAALQSLGVRHIRDGLPASSTFQGDFQQLAAAGIHCTCGFALPNSLTVAQISSYTQIAQSVEALEAPNECDAGTNCGGGGATGIANVVAFLPTLAAASAATNLPVVGPSFELQSGYATAGNIAPEINYNNLHVYFGGHNPGSAGWGEGDPQGHFYGSFDWWIDQGNLDAAGTPDMITETGYMAFPTATQVGTIPESVEASYTPRTVLIAFNKGIKRTFIYELLDEWSTTGYGLLANDFSAKPAYTALKNLIGALQDPGSSFNPGSLNYSISGNTNTLQHLLLQKRDGSYWLVLWLEQSSYDADNNVPTPVTPQNVSLSIGAGSKFGELIQFDPTGNASTSGLSNSGYTAPLTISDQVTIVQILPR